MSKTTRTVEGPTSTVKTTTYESRSSYEGDDGASHVRRYKPTIGQRSTIIQRTGYGGGPQNMSRQMVSHSYGSSGISAQAFSNISHDGVENVKTSRKQEKKDMQDLNERFASYIEKVRFLEAQNRKLADELDKLKSKWGKETTAIKAMYQAELEEARRLLDDAEKDKANLEVKQSSLEETIEEISNENQRFRSQREADKDKLERQNQQLSDYEAEINLLRRRLETLEADRDKDKKEIARLSEALNRARLDLDNETLMHIDAENRRQTLEEELEFLKNVHEQELKELAALAYRDTTQENRDFWKSEMAGALREIQIVYDDKLEGMKGELETYYNMKIQEFRTGAARQNMESVHSKDETKRLRTQVSDLRSKVADLESRNAQLEKEIELLRREYSEKEKEWESDNGELKVENARLRAEMEAILKELQDIMDTKLGLELEIAAYRKLLEGEENRVGLRQVVESIVATQEQRMKTNERVFLKQTETTSGDASLKVSQVVRGEMSAKTTYQRSAKGPVSIAECSADGKFIAFENNGRKEENLYDWTIDRSIDGEKKPDFKFNSHFSVRPGQKVKVWSGGKPSSAGAGDIESGISSWGIGANITTKLINPNGEDRATHVQKTSYSSQ